MSDIGIKVDIGGLDEAVGLLGRIVGMPESELLDQLGRQIQQQTRDRIEDEKTAPDGTPWKKNRAGTPTLYREGNLARSIEFEPSGSTVAVGSSLIYARIHQLGGEIRPVAARALHFKGADGGDVFARSVTIPARPYLGLSDENRRDVLEATVDFVRRKVVQ